MTNQDMFLCLKVCGRTTNNILKKSMRKVLVTTISSPIPEKAATIQPQSTTGFGMRYGIVELRIKDGPRVHDLRHTFAVRSMQKLKKSKSDIVTTLPYLSAYLGHCNMSATQIYLHLTAECYPEFIQKQCDYLGDTIPTWEAPNENC